MITNLITLLTEEAIKALIAIPKKKKAGDKIHSDISPTAGGKQKGLKKEGKEIAQDLINQALQNGLQLQVSNFSNRSLSGGNTAEFVGELILNVPFVFKMDSVNKKLAREAKAIRTIKNDTELPASYRESWPQIYAIRSEAPYAYLMEYFNATEGWQSLETLLYGAKNHTLTTTLANRYMTTAMEKLMEGFKHSVNKRNNPNTKEDYLFRIKERLSATANANPRYRSVTLQINGHTYKPWQHYIDLIEGKSSFLSQISPGFSTVVHGDPNPGNILLNTTDQSLPVKFIDPKDWVTGDYLFDICKITHFLSVTGPVEHPVNNAPSVSFKEGVAGYIIDYVIDRPEWTDDLIQICTDSAKSFALEAKDKQWEHRYQLGMAANLLGLPLGRLEKKRDDAAAILYAEGIKWLDEFCKILTND